MVRCSHAKLMLCVKLLETGGRVGFVLFWPSSVLSIDHGNRGETVRRRFRDPPLFAQSMDDSFDAEDSTP